MKKPKLVALLILFVITSLVLFGCKDEAATDTSDTTDEVEDTNDVDENENANNEVDVNEITEYKQSPMLDGQDLPPVAERLPLEPKLTNELPESMLEYEIGTYGGTLKTVTDIANTDLEIFILSNEPLLNTPGILGEEITGNVLKDYEVTDDQKTFTFYMREGLKWSDGEPVTVEDVRFTVEDVLNNEELTPIFPALFRAGGEPDGEPMEFEIIDDYTFKLSFSEPYGGLPIRIAIENWRGYTELLKPAHFLKKYHKDYADEAELTAAMEEDGIEPGEGAWVNLFHLKDVTNWENTTSNAKDFPVLYPWIISDVTQTSTQFVRNPYYFKIDAEGNQLPYIDELESTLVQDVEMVTLKTIGGEVDFLRIATALNKMPLYRENAEQGGYNALLSGMHITPTDIFLNLTHEDPVWREVVRDIRFRQALNYAINREEIIDTIYFGYAEPSTITDSTYDLEKANQLLDEMGMEKGSDGFRRAPDGSEFSIPFEVQAAAPDIVPLAEIMVQQWQEIGIKVTMKTISGELWGTRRTANQLKASIMWTHTPLWYMRDWGQGFWGPLWERWWNTNGAEGEEPPEDVKEIYELIDKVASSSPEEARAAIEQVREEIHENLWYFVHIEEVKQPLIVNENLGNVTEKGMAISTHYAGEQFFFKNE